MALMMITEFHDIQTNFTKCRYKEKVNKVPSFPQLDGSPGGTGPISKFKMSNYLTVYLFYSF